MSNWFKARYGSRSGIVQTIKHKALYHAGRYNKYSVPWNCIERLVFVCAGNICRSPFAEVVAKSLGVNSISVGLYATEGGAANDMAIITARTMGYDMEYHRTKQIMYASLKKSDLLVVMEPWQAELVKNNLSETHYVTMLGLWTNPKRPYIADPYLLSEDYFKNCFAYIEKSVHAILVELQNRA